MPTQTKTQKVELLHQYLPELQTLKPQAEAAYGSRATDSANHEASRQYTSTIKEYAEKGGSLLMLAEALGVTYPALRRRVMTADIRPLDRGHRSTATEPEYQSAVANLQALRARKDQTIEYHDTLLSYYNAGFSINRLAKELGLKSAYPLYYGINKARLRAGQ